MNPRDFHALAERLSKGPAADIRTSIGRSYYATFNVAAELLRGLGFPVARNAAAHGEVVHCMRGSGNKEVEAAGHALLDLHGFRNRADYQLDRADVEGAANAVAMADLAGQTIHSLDRAFSGPDREAIRQGIQAWRKATGYP
jgi:hypothetical protein